MCVVKPLLFPWVCFHVCAIQMTPNYAETVSAVPLNCIFLIKFLSLFHLWHFAGIQVGRAPVHWSPGHLRFRELRRQLVRAALHQLHKREPAAVLRPAHLQDGAGGVWPGAHQLEAHWVCRQPGLLGHDRRQTNEHHCVGRRGESIPKGWWKESELWSLVKVLDSRYSGFEHD